MGEPGPEAENLGLGLVEGEHQEGPVEQDRAARGDGGGDDLAADVGVVNTCYGTEQQPGEIAPVAAGLAGHDDHRQRQHANEQEADGGVGG